MISFEKFKEYYVKYNRLPFGIYTSPKGLNDRQMLTKYERYVKSENRKEEKRESKGRDAEWESVRKLMFETKGRECWFIKILSIDQIEILRKKAGTLIRIIDPAHIFPKDTYPQLKYDIDNIVPINRYSHHCLDFLLHPVTGRAISKKQKNMFWVDIVGINHYNELLKRAMC